MSSTQHALAHPSRNNPVPGRESPQGARAGLTVFLSFFLLYAAYSGLRYERYSFTNADPGWMVQAVISLVQDGDLDIKNQLGADPVRAEDQTALGARGEWFPLHEPVLAGVAVPFYLAAGINGLLLFNLLCAAATQTLVFAICASVTSQLLAFGAAALTGFGTLFLVYSYSFSQDLWGALLIIAAFFSIMNRYNATGGALFGFAVLSRHTAVAAAPGLLFLLLTASASARRKELVRFVVAGLPFACALAAYNSWAYGSPWHSSYHLWQRYQDGQLLLVDQLQATFVKPWLEGFAELLFNREWGLLGSVAAWPLVAAGLVIGLRDRNRPVAAVALIMLGHLLLFCRFEGFPGTPGNRYLMAPVALAALPTALVFERLRTLLGGRSHGPTPQEFQ